MDARGTTDGDAVDIAGHAFGKAHEHVAVASRSDVIAALARARDAGRPVVADGLRTSYWHNQRHEGAFVLDVSGLRHEGPFDVERGFATFGAGCTVRSVDRSLRTRGFHLGIHPDSYGDTSLGAALANGVSAGIGMLHGEFASQVVGFEMVCGDGRVVSVGASRQLSGRAGPFGGGMPDLRSLVVGSEGRLGVITEVDVALVPAPEEAHLDVSGMSAVDALALARWVRRRRLVHTLRWSDDGEQALHLRVVSDLDRDDLERRVAWVVQRLGHPTRIRTRFIDEAERSGELPAYDVHWPGPPGSAWAADRAHPFAGLDFVAAYPDVLPIVDRMRAFDPGVRHTRRLSLYAGCDGVNVGLHCTAFDFAARDTLRTALYRLRDGLSDVHLLPYKTGIMWLDYVRTALDPDTKTVLSEAASRFGPPLNPGVGVFAAASGD